MPRFFIHEAWGIKGKSGKSENPSIKVQTFFYLHIEKFAHFHIIPLPLHSKF